LQFEKGKIKKKIEKEKYEGPYILLGFAGDIITSCRAPLRVPLLSSFGY
jgi:hypothetical protein